jgi:hypothetical protein
MLRWSTFLLGSALMACRGADPGATPADAAEEAEEAADAAAAYSIAARIVLTPDADGGQVSFVAENGATVTLSTSDIVGKTVRWGTAVGGEPIQNATQIDKGLTTMQPDLTSLWITPAHYTDGPWEMACIIDVSGVLPPNIPAPGDLAAVDDTPPPPGDPPVTGVSIRVHIEGGDAYVEIPNKEFIPFGFAP